ncbi:hypothetical protein LV164_003456 [Aspergillus fumigatus]|nr:hypothetical protein KXX42_002937 [Aspergillus fumigatus]KAH1552141.1 hypothetical protein KXX57_008004 [Aspergillus fumigatus]KAH1982537.1 hypothetical protein KXW88_004582 [Aspergillus fumigatus]KAH2315534.1 hypothetical protein KXV47_001782 [Aspergillus fumigatus]KAH2671542.1 hypothetical protein KXV32_001980 [Aspergillus fumigatus]
MVLLTSSTVSVILSTGVVCLFTLLLFLSGYVLQQQSVRSIQSALRPPGVPDPVTGHGSAGSSFQKREQSTLSNLIPEEQQKHVAHHAQPGAGGNYAYLQLLSSPNPSDICSAILFFKQLATKGTAINDRLFMYPREWDLLSSDKVSDSVRTALSLLRAASIKYNVWLLPIDMTAVTSAGYQPTDTTLLRLGQIQFMQYDSVLYVQTPGLLLDTGKLDEMLLSRPLPLKYDKDRPESFNNEAWIPMPLRADRDATLPPVYLITVNNVKNGQIEARGHIPNVALPGFGGLVTSPRGVHTLENKGNDPADEPGYVFFEQDGEGHVQWAQNPLFGAWRAQQHEVCEGVDFDEVAYDHD